jgi:hypothetical protein
LKKRLEAGRMPVEQNCCVWEAGKEERRYFCLWEGRSVEGLEKELKP